MERIDRDRYRLSTGRVLSAGHGGVIGLAEEHPDYPDLGLFLAGGYDGPLSVWPPLPGDDGHNLTPYEEAEVAAHMLGLWQRVLADALTRATAPAGSPRG